VLFRPRVFDFVWFKNFQTALADPVFWISLRHTVIWIVITVPAQMLLGLATALLLNQEFPWRGLARALVIIPWALPSVVIALMWVWIYDSNYGVLNDLLLRMNLITASIPWLANPDTALYAIILTLTWQGFPFFAVMILAGLQGIPKSYYEAAAIDGASSFRQFWHITLPVTAMVLGSFAVTAMLTKNAFLEEIRKQYVVTARAKGLSERQVMWKHVFRNALIPIVTGFPAAFIGAFFAGSLLIETLFSLDGLGLLSYESVIRRDYPVVLGTLFLFTLIGLVTKLVSDLCYVWVDPRVRFD